MQKQKSQKHFPVVVLLTSGKTKTVDVKASTREVAERRALKRTESAVDIWRP